MATHDSDDSLPPTPDTPESTTADGILSGSSAVTDFAIPNNRSVNPTAFRPAGLAGATDASSVPKPNPLGSVQSARGPTRPSPQSMPSASLDSMQAKLKAFSLSRQAGAGTPPVNRSPAMAPVPARGPGGFAPPPGRTGPMPAMNARLPPGKGAVGGMAGRRAGPKMNLADAMGPAPTAANGSTEAAKPPGQESAFAKYSQYVDTATGTLRFPGRATITGTGIDFGQGSEFKISLDEVDTIEELGKGNYGTVYLVRHARPSFRKQGQGLAGIQRSNVRQQTNTSGKVMAMKEIRLELDESKFAAIIMELDILHRCVSPFIVDFYGAFFQEGAVYICLEWMDGGSIDKIYADGVPEDVLRKITLSTVMGLKSLKDEHNIIHRDVKPTNILINTKGQVKICDFGVSGNLVASIAKTNIGCQSYMAPERISGGGIPSAGANPGGGTYSVQSDIWSLGLTIVECATGRYPYPPETYNNIFSQLSAIVEGEPPALPEDKYSPEARDFVARCLHKVPAQRPSYAQLCRHPWLTPLLRPPTNPASGTAPATAGAPSTSTSDSADADEEDTSDPQVAEWCVAALEKKRAGKMKGVEKPALHAAPMDNVAPETAGVRA